MGGKDAITGSDCTTDAATECCSLADVLDIRQATAVEAEWLAILPESSRNTIDKLAISPAVAMEVYATDDCFAEAAPD